MRSALRLLLIASANGARLSLHKAAELGDLPPLKVASEGYRDEYEDEWVKTSSLAAIGQNPVLRSVGIGFPTK